MKKLICTFIKIAMIALVGLSVYSPINVEAKAKLLNWNLVGKDKHLNWSGKTRYQKEFDYGVRVWNKHKKGVIRKKSRKMKNNLTVSDYTKKEPVVAVTSGRGTIKINNYHMRNLTTNQKRNVMIHELGHALGLAHNTKSDVVFTYVTSKTTLSKNDKESYNAVYKKYK